MLFLGGVFAISTIVMVYRITPERRRRQTLLWLLSWGLKGLVLPLALWTVLNLGVTWWLQPFMPDIQFSQNTGGKWWLPFCRFVGYGIFIVSSYWMALTLGWAVIRSAANLDDESRANFKGLCWTCCLGMFLPALLIEILGGLPTLGLAATVILGPIAGCAPAVLHTRKTPPMYARAVARIKFGKYAEAEWEIIRELEKCEDDFDGWMMLAELYANQFQDLAEAEQTILEICDHPNTTPSQLSIALHRLADWHLKLGGDPDAARRALQVVCDRLRGSHLAHMAQLRINQLPATAEDLREEQARRPIPLPALRDPLDEARAPGEPTPEADPKDALRQANACVDRLRQNPNYVPAREKLARLLAEHLNQPERGLEQLTLLLNIPEQPPDKYAEWLALAAAWNLKYRQDHLGARRFLERLVREFPHSPQAFAARRRLQAMEA